MSKMLDSIKPKYLGNIFNDKELLSFNEKNIFSIYN